jgi:NADH:ubiquinone oxidoreductase subunit 3 (subunit A)
MLARSLGGCDPIVLTVAQIVTPTGVEPAFDLGTYYPIFIYLVLILGFAVSSIVGSQLVGPKKRTAVKLMPYESGMDPIGSAHHQFDIKFYLIAILFLVFDVELLFLYPWAVIAYRDGIDVAWRTAFRTAVFVEVLVFIASLAVAYVYAWRKGVFQWR